MKEEEASNKEKVATLLIGTFMHQFPEQFMNKSKTKSLKALFELKCHESSGAWNILSMKLLLKSFEFQDKFP